MQPTCCSGIDLTGLSPPKCNLYSRVCMHSLFAALVACRHTVFTWLYYANFCCPRHRKPCVDPHILGRTRGNCDRFLSEVCKSSELMQSIPLEPKNHEKNLGPKNMGYCLTPKDGGGSNIPYFHPYLGKIDPFRLIFSVGLKPPPSIFGSVLYIHLYRRFNGGPVCLGMYVEVCRPYHAPCFYFMRPKWIAADWHTGSRPKGNLVAKCHCRVATDATPTFWKHQNPAQPTIF